MNPYRELVVSPRATDREVSRAYKRLAKRCHPDLHPEDESAAERMGRLNRAYGDIKAMRRRGRERDAEPGPVPEAAPARPKPLYVAAVLAAVVTFFLVRLVLGLLFGG